jgi:hypothetical protein
MDYVILDPMEKRAPHYKLPEILAIVAAQGLGAFTATATFNAAAMGLSEAQAVAVVMSITRAMFYKSMTIHNDNRKPGRVGTFFVPTRCGHQNPYPVENIRL